MLDPEQNFLTRPRPRMLVIAGLFLLCSAVVTAAATPLRIDIQSVTIEARVNWSQPYVHIEALDEAQNRVTYGGAGSFVASFVGAGPFRAPRTVNTDFFHGNTIGFGGVVSGGGFSQMEGHADPITLFPTVRRKPEAFIRIGSAGFHGRFEYWAEPNGLVAFDDDVVLEGNYQAFLSNRNYMDGRYIELTKLIYVLKKPENLSGLRTRPWTRESLAD